MAAASVATLPMYDWPEVADATDALWAELRSALGTAGFDAPETLARPDDPEPLWRDPNLLLGQTCGLPFALGMCGDADLVATPCHAAEGCDGPLYRSALIVRRDGPARHLASLHGRRAAINARNSYSGFATFGATIAKAAGKKPCFGEIVETGGHRASVLAVAEGRADIAAIDCVAWAFARRHDPDHAAALRVLGWTGPAPGLPLITAGGRPDDERRALRDAVLSVCGDRSLEDIRAELLIAGAEVVGGDDYAPALDRLEQARTVFSGTV